MGKPLIPYAIKDGEMIHIESVESGLKCGCICPGCNEHLIARKGEVMTHHFAHKSGSECASHGESVVHWIAKTWFAENTEKIIVADTKVKVSDPLLIWDGFATVCISPFMITLSDIQLEKKSGPFIPDVKAVSASGVEVWIEICVSHSCEPEKINWCNQKGIILVEASISPDGFNFESFDSILSKTIFKPLSSVYPAIKAECNNIRDSHVEQAWEYIIEKAERDREYSLERKDFTLKEMFARQAMDFWKKSKPSCFFIDNHNGFCPKVWKHHREHADQMDKPKFLPDKGSWNGKRYARFSLIEHIYFGSLKIYYDQNLFFREGDEIWITKKQTSYLFVYLFRHENAKNRAKLGTVFANEGCRRCKHNLGSNNRTVACSFVLC